MASRLAELSARPRAPPAWRARAPSCAGCSCAVRPASRLPPPPPRRRSLAARAAGEAGELDTPAPASGGAAAGAASARAAIQAQYRQRLQAFKRMLADDPERAARELAGAPPAARAVFDELLAEIAAMDASEARGSGAEGYAARGAGEAGPPPPPEGAAAAPRRAATAPAGPAAHPEAAEPSAAEASPMPDSFESWLRGMVCEADPGADVEGYLSEVARVGGAHYVELRRVYGEIAAFAASTPPEEALARYAALSARLEAATAGLAAEMDAALRAAVAAPGSAPAVAAAAGPGSQAAEAAGPSAAAAAAEQQQSPPPPPQPLRGPPLELPRAAASGGPQAAPPAGQPRAGRPTTRIRRGVRQAA